MHRLDDVVIRTPERLDHVRLARPRGEALEGLLPAIDVDRSGLGEGAEQHEMCAQAEQQIGPHARGRLREVLGAAALVLALGTGLVAAVDLHVGAAAHQAVAAHVKAAVLTTLLAVPAALWRGIGVAPEAMREMPRYAKALALALSLAGRGAGMRRSGE